MTPANRIIICLAPSAWAQEMLANILRAFSVPTGIRSNAAEGDDDVDDDDSDDPWLQKC